MSRHLTTDERLALVEAPERPDHPHLASCERCRREVTEARALIADARTTEVPEPSPLFWQHFSERVSENLAREPRPVARRVGWRWVALAPLGAAALVVIAVAVGRGRAPHPGVPEAPLDAAVVATGVENVEAPPDDEAWLVLSQIAGDFDVETVGDSVGRDVAGAADAVAAQLSDGEREELGRLLRAEVAAGR